MLPVKWTSREKVRDLARANPGWRFYDVSTNAPLANIEGIIDAHEFSPFMAYGDIPIPGTTQKSDSVEGVWQGLKIIDGKIDPSYFKGKGRNFTSDYASNEKYV